MHFSLTINALHRKPRKYGKWQFSKETQGNEIERLPNHYPIMK